MSVIDTYLNDEAQVLRQAPREQMENAAQILRQARRDGKRIFIFGNGGSAATASHFVVDLLKGALHPDKPRIKIIGLTDNVPTLTALANDVGYDVVFAEPLASLAEEGDVAIAISGSGNSPNVLRALEVARQRKLTTIGLTGFSGGKMKDLVDVPIIVQATSMQLIEDAHVVILHAIFRDLCAS